MGMRVFVCEYVTGGGLSDLPLPASLQREGDMMLASLVKDVLDVPEMTVVLTRDCRLPAPDLPVAVEWIGTEGPWPIWRRIIESVDAVWPIAPETGRALERLSNLVLAAGRTLLGSHPDAVRLTASKRTTAEHLARFGLPVVPTSPLGAARPSKWPAGPDGWVVKPDDGVGAEEMLFLARPDALESWRDRRADAERFVLQPFVPGEAASLSLLCGGGQASLLACNRQDVRIEDGRFVYRGGIVGGLEHRRAAYEPIAAAVARAIPGLWGYVGVDLVDGGSGPVLLEVNPRLTTSFTGLRRAIGANPAGLVLDLLERGVADMRRPLNLDSVPISVGGAHG